MLAISLPGKKRDLAPYWMVQDAQVHSKQNHKQHERVGKSFSRGGGGCANVRDGGASHEKGRGKDHRQGGDGGGKNKGAVTNQVAVAGVVDADDALRMGAGRCQGLPVPYVQHSRDVLPQAQCRACDGPQ